MRSIASEFIIILVVLMSSLVAVPTLAKFDHWTPDSDDDNKFGTWTPSLDDENKFGQWTPHLDDENKFDTWTPSLDDENKFDTWTPRLDGENKFDTWTPRLDDDNKFGAWTPGLDDGNKIACYQTELKSCMPSVKSGGKPSETCCKKVKEQKPCLCGYFTDPAFTQIVSSASAHRILKACDVPYPTC